MKPRLNAILAFFPIWLGVSFTLAQEIERKPLGSIGLGANRQGATIVFLGDSNTYTGTWVSLLDAWQMNEIPTAQLRLLNLGLSSETASGLSEPTHPFPRPDVKTRIDSVLEKTKPDVVFICYGMNDGIYHPQSEERFQAYQTGIREVVTKVQKTGALVVLITPPIFDALPVRAKGKLQKPGAERYSWEFVSDEYDQVVAQYASWITGQTRLADLVIDIHTPMKKAVMMARSSDPSFTFAGDGIHYNQDGHRLVAKTVLEAFGVKTDLSFDAEMMKLVTERQKVLRDAYLTFCGHGRPGVPKGKSIEEAMREADALESRIRKR